MDIETPPKILSASPPATLPAEFQDQIVQIYAELGAAGWVQAVLFFNTPLHADRLRQAVRLMLDAEPVLGCRFDGAVEPPVWRRRDDLDRLELCREERIDAVGSSLEHHLTVNLPGDEAPNLHCVLLRHDDGDVLIVRISHVAADGPAVLDVIYGLAALYTSLARDRNYRPEPNSASRDSFIWMRSVQWRDWASVATRAALDLGRRSGRQWALTGDPARSLGSANRSDPYCLVERLDDSMIAAIETAARLRRCTLNDVLLGAFFRAYHDFIGAPPGLQMKVIMPVSLRRYAPLEKRPAIRNLGSFATIGIGRELGPDIGATVDRVTAEVKRHRAGLFGLTGQLTTPLTARLSYRTKRKLLGSLVRKAAQRPALPCVTNVGICRSDRLDFAGTRPTELTLTLSPMPLPVFLLLAVRYDHSLALSMSGYGSDLPRARVAAFLATVKQQMCAFQTETSVQQEMTAP